MEWNRHRIGFVTGKETGRKVEESDIDCLRKGKKEEGGMKRKMDEIEPKSLS